jgi:membrane protease YdiL (CAAX protease family)
MAKNKKAIIVFLIITFVLSSVCYFIYISIGESAAGMTSLLMWCPGLSAIIVKIVFYKKEKVLGFGKCKLKYILMGLLIPVLYLGVSYGIYWAINPSALTGQVYSKLVGFMIAAFLSFVVTAIGEEIGWRGFLLPKMNEMFSYSHTVIICGLIWAVWHYPIMIAGLYQSGTPVYYQLPMFTIEIVLVTAILAYLRMNSDNVWPAILLHASHNYFNQMIFGSLTKADKSIYYAGETGFLTVLCLLVIVICLHKKHKRSVAN